MEATPKADTKTSEQLTRMSVDTNKLKSMYDHTADNIDRRMARIVVVEESVSQNNNSIAAVEQSFRETSMAQSLIKNALDGKASKEDLTLAINSLSKSFQTRLATIWNDTTKALGEKVSVDRFNDALKYIEDRFTRVDSTVNQLCNRMTSAAMQLSPLPHGYPTPPQDSARMLPIQYPQQQQSAIVLRGPPGIGRPDARIEQVVPDNAPRLQQSQQGAVQARMTAGSANGAVVDLT
jgi:hypothetical protein